MAGRVTASVDAAHDPMLDASDWPSQLLYLKVLRRPLEPSRATAIAVVDEPRGRPARGERLVERPECELLPCVRRRGGADDLAGVDVEHDRQIEPPFARAQLGDVSHPELVRRSGFEPPVHEVRSGRHGRTHRGRTKEALLGTASDALPTHDPGNAVPSGRFAFPAKRPPDPRRPVGLATLSVHASDTHRQPFIVAIAERRLATEPGVVAAAGDLQDPTHAAYPEGLPVLLDEPKLHFWSSAK